MQSLKKYLLEGLIQVAIMLSLCGVRVDVGLEPYLPGSWPENILGPTSALTQTQFHNLRNRLEGGTGLHPKNVDLDEFFTTRRLLGWVRSLDRLQVPQAELETWLVQQDPSPLPVRLLQQTAPERLILPEQPRMGWDEPEEELEDSHPEAGRRVLYGSVGLEETDEDMDDEEQAHYMRTEEAGGLYYDQTDIRERAQEEEDQNSASLQECLRLLDETFSFTNQQQVCSTGRSGVPSDSPPSDMEQHWQDLLDLMEPQNSDVDMRTLLDQTPDSNPSVYQPDPLSQNYLPQAEQEGPLMDNYLQHDVLGPTHHSEDLLPLVPTDQLDNHSLDTFHTNNSHNPPPHVALLEDNFSMGLNADTNSSHFNLLPEELSTDVSSFLLGEDDLEDLSGGLDDILEEAAILEEMSLLDLALEEGFSPEMTERLEEEGYLDPELTHRTSQLSLNMEQSEAGQSGDEYSQTINPDVKDEADSDSGLSLDSSHSPASPSESEASSYSSSSSSSSASSLLSNGQTMELEVTIKQEPLDEEELGAVGGDYYQQDSKNFYTTNFYSDHKLFDGFPWLEQISHDHTYNQPWSSDSRFSPKISARRFKSSPKHEKPYQLPKHMWNRDERRARALKIPFSNELIINLPVEEFNDLLARYELDEEQLTLVRDIRRRGKNKIAAQNCRQRKMDTLIELKTDVSMLRRHKSRLLKEKQEALKTLQNLKQRLSMLYQDVFSSLRDEEGRPLDVNEYMLSFEGNGSVDVVSRSQNKGSKSSRKQKDKKK